MNEDRFTTKVGETHPDWSGDPVQPPSRLFALPVGIEDPNNPGIWMWTDNHGAAFEAAAGMGWVTHPEGISTVEDARAYALALLAAAETAAG